MGRKVPPRMRPVRAPPLPMAVVAALPMASEMRPPRGWRTQMAAVPARRKVRSGTRKRLSVSGMRRRSRFSMRVARAATRRTEMMPPRPGTSGAPKRVMCARSGWASRAPRMPPRMGVPPNSSAVLRPTMMFMPQKTVELATARSWKRGEAVRALSYLPTTLRQPLMRPQAMKPGMSGMKMLAMRLKKSLTGVAFRARIRAWRALPSPICGWEVRPSGQGVSACEPAAAGAAWRSVCRAASTAAALPGPRMSCSSLPLTLVPRTPGMAASWALRPSVIPPASSRRRRVMQW